MEIFKHEGDILELNSGVIIHGCNSKGVMGSGIAKQIRDKYPQVFKDYTEHIRWRNQWRDSKGTAAMTDLGNRGYTEDGHKKLIILSAITQENYGTDKNVVYVDYNAIGGAFTIASEYCRSYGLDLHFPLIGCGLANGDWKTVEQLIDKKVARGVRKHLWVLPEKAVTATSTTTTA